MALVQKFKQSRVPVEPTSKVILSVGNVIMHINSNTNIDGSACASDLPGHAMTEKSVHLSYDSIIESALETLQGHMKASQRQLIQSLLLEFFKKISVSRLEPSNFKDNLIPFMEEMARHLPSVKCALRQKSVSVVICAPLKQWDPDTTLRTMSKFVSMPQNHQLPGQ